MNNYKNIPERGPIHHRVTDCGTYLRSTGLKCVISSSGRILFGMCMLVTLAANAQDNKRSRDSLTRLMKKVNRVYPAIRPFSFQMDYVGNRGYNTTFKKEDIEEGNINESLRTKSFVTFPSYKKGHVVIYGTFTHVYQKLSLRNTQRIASDHPQFRPERNVETHDLTLSLNGVYKDSLFNRPIIVSSAFMFNSRNFKSVEKLRGIVNLVIILKATRTTVITAGAVAIIDPSANLPFTPLFTYWHRFKNEWQFDFVLPSRIYLRHPLRSGWISAGTELSRIHGFDTPDQLILTGTYEMAQLLLQSGVNLEYPVSKNVLFGVRGGYETSIAARTVKLNGRQKDHVSSSKINPGAFISFSLAYVPGQRRDKQKGK